MQRTTDRQVSGPIDDRLRAAGLPALPRSAWLEIDLDAVASNFATIAALAGPGVPIMPVVKADAYGHGALAVARALTMAGAAGFCVATFDEAVELRKGGIRLPVLVLYPVPAQWAVAAARAGISVTAGDLPSLKATLAATGATRPRRRLEIHLEVETGLGRGGLMAGDVVAAARSIAEAAGARFAGLWTHLQAPERPTSRDGQVALFEDVMTTLRAAGISLPRRHLRASASLVNGSSVVDGGVASHDGVRPGLSIYGLVPDELRGSPLAAAAGRLRPALSLHARAVRVAELAAGWGIGYGPSFRTSRPSRIATLPVGYGDGWSRSLSNRAEALVRGVRVPTVGNVAMDAVMVDVTDVPGEPVSMDDEFVLIGRQGTAEIGAADVAAVRGTNTWEVVAAMARRLPRVYHAASGPVAVRSLVSGGLG